MELLTVKSFVDWNSIVLSVLGVLQRGDWEHFIFQIIKQIGILEKDNKSKHKMQFLNDSVYCLEGKKLKPTLYIL